METRRVCAGIIFAVWSLAAAPLLAQGPLRPKPRPPGAETSSPRPLPSVPRIGQEPIKQQRDTFRYVPPSDPVLAKAIEAAFNFQQQLPDFICHERMTRSRSNNLGEKWKKDDVVEAELLTVGGKTQYRDIKIDGRATGASDFAEIGGPASIGDYDLVVINVLNPRSRAQFTNRRPDNIGDRNALLYDFNIEERYSRFQVGANGRRAAPAYHGRVWIDPENGRVLRVETETNSLPHDFPLSSVAGVLHYDDVEIDGQSYLLPAGAVNMSCQRGSKFCTRLDIEFLDYRKFTSESTLFTTDSDIEFGQEIPDRPEPQHPKER